MARPQDDNEAGPKSQTSPNEVAPGWLKDVKEWVKNGKGKNGLAATGGV